MDALGCDVCLSCYERESGKRPVPRDHLHGCPVCGDPQGARYGQERICWPCFITRYELVAERHRKRKPSEFERRFHQVWDWMEMDGYAMTTGDGPVVIVGYCPRCANTMTARFYNHPVDVEFECQGPCTSEQIVERLGRRQPRAA